MKQGHYVIYPARHRTLFCVMMIRGLLTLCLLLSTADVASGQPGNPLRLDIMERDTLPTAIPEPASIMMFLSVLSLLIYRSIRHKLASETCLPKAAEAFPQKTFSEHGHVIASEQIMAEVAHDVKNLLTGIRTCTEVLEYPELSHQDHQEFTTTILKNIDQAVEMLQQVLNTTRGQASELHLESVPIHMLLRETLRALEPDFIRHKIDVRSDVADTGNCLIDSVQIKRVFTNIVLNARDAMPNGGTLTVSCREVNDSVEVTIADTGCGMSPELQAQIFKPFVTFGKSHGTGLGLTIVKSILDAHHASIAIQSQEGHGTTIKLTFSQ